MKTASLTSGLAVYSLALLPSPTASFNDIRVPSERAAVRHRLLQPASKPSYTLAYRTRIRTYTLMRLLHIAIDGRLSRTYHLDGPTPPYAILSHTWDRQEVAFEDFEILNNAEDTGAKCKTGWDRIRFCAQQAKRDALDYLWVDTCCIDKANNMELQQAINSMFCWYQNAKKCYVYLSDVEYNTSIGDSKSLRRWEPAFRKSRWFTRGWTLQELLGPASIAFYSKEGELLGDKQSLKDSIHEITKIPALALEGCPLSEFSIEERLSWIAKRTTMFKEDKVYCLLGIFGVYLPLIYGEGEAHATLRLIEGIQKQQARSGVNETQTLPSMSHAFTIILCQYKTELTILKRLHN
jgi:hypothetical protein